MMENPELLAPCGTYCGVCPYLIAYKTNNESLKEKLAKSIGIKPEQIVCDGCKSDNPLFFCKSCAMKTCVAEKDVESCAVCGEFPCIIIEKFPFKQFIQRVRWDANYRKDHSKEEWLAKTIEMNSCPSCKNLEHWRANTCKSCGTTLEERYVKS